MTTPLSSADWAEIEAEYRAGMPAKVLAQRYSIRPGTIHSRACKKKWRETRVRAAAQTQAERLERAVDRLETILQRVPRANP
ncbi:hypothetical protein B0G81_3962 [Paraburkholderia sp. BL6665CI2N2]|uniref:hypothetical protein n=1 Tax=Paraburkholderia sp. BL6665CI2N2 TaxID=1938806 RepID=UPI0010668C36|nr:hypothetical protein [Paraburkholderia sp. BL6665CI2N2]TDY23580.1 hypothetical protein B0G81_3962 [Paraburkholderia sp. BL6665CI2N2]